MGDVMGVACIFPDICREHPVSVGFLNGIALLSIAKGNVIAACDRARAMFLSLASA
jgi:hypothetical protein